MSAEAAIRARLLAVTAVTDIVDTRVYHAVIPREAAHPAIAFQTISGLAFDSALADDGNKYENRIQLTLVADTIDARLTLQDAVLSALQRFKGASGGVTVLDCELENIYDLPWDETTQRTARVIDFSLYWE